MILSFFIIILFVIIAAAFLFFIFKLFLPSLSAQTIKAADIMFPRDDFFKYGSSYVPHNVSKKKAVVVCPKDTKLDDNKNSYKGERDCSLLVSCYNEDSSDYIWRCAGLGNCARVCPRNAIDIEDNIAVVNTMCNGCGLCIDVCPIHLIKLIP